MTSPYKGPSSVRTLEGGGGGGGRLNVTCGFGCSQSIRFIFLLRSLSHHRFNDFIEIKFRLTTEALKKPEFVLSLLRILPRNFII